MTTNGLANLILGFLATRNTATLDEVAAHIKGEGYSRKQAADSLRGLKKRSAVCEPIKGRYAVEQTTASAAAADAQVVPAPKPRTAPVQASLAVEPASKKQANEVAIMSAPTARTVVADAMAKMKGRKAADPSEKRWEPRLTIREMQALIEAAGGLPVDGGLLTSARSQLEKGIERAQGRIARGAKTAQPRTGKVQA